MKTQTFYPVYIAWIMMLFSLSMAFCDRNYFDEYKVHEDTLFGKTELTVEQQALSVFEKGPPAGRSYVFNTA